MISVEDLIQWANDNAIGRSTSYPKGWVSSDQLLLLAENIKNSDPLPFRYSLIDNLPKNN